MSWLFCAVLRPLNCDNTAAASFNEDIGAWTPPVTSMHLRSTTRRPLTKTSVVGRSTTSRAWLMFGHASSLNQDLGCAWTRTRIVDVDAQGNSYGGAAGVYFSGTIQVAFLAPVPSTQAASSRRRCGVFSSRNIRTAVTAWISTRRPPRRRMATSRRRPAG